MKKFKQLLMLLSLLICFLFSTVHVMAADESLGKVVDGSVLTEKNEVESTVYPWARGSYLSHGVGRLTLAGLGQVKMSGDTVAYQTVDEIKITLHLQRLKSDESGWVHVTTLGPKTAKNTSTVSNSQTYSVAHGYYFRVYGVHTVTHGGKVESATNYSDGIWVS
ncbi:MAG: hypothetical protein HFG96_11585 [Lachnospiraceae bacterium]|jgi:hypothetical protein|nr:hypothetical protein [Lachnospiraceae bacterium]